MTTRAQLSWGLGLALCTACGAEADDDPQFRTQFLDVDLTIHEGDTVEAPDCVLFDIIGGGVHDGAATSTNRILDFDGTDIRTADGQSRCYVDRSGPMTRLRRTDDDETAVYTVFHKYVLAGDFEFPPDGGIANLAVYSFKQDEIFEGVPNQANQFAIATANVQFASDERKLLITAALDGTCGTFGY